MLRDLWYRMVDRWYVGRLIRHYRKHPEDYDADKDIFLGGAGGWEE